MAAKFVWVELMSPDPAAAERFYTSVVGWTAEDAGMGPDMAYTLMKVGQTQVAGLMGMPPELAAIGRPPLWTGYLGVDDVDAGLAQVIAAGGKSLQPAMDIPEIGRFAAVADVQGAPFALFKPLRDDPPPAVAPGAAGTVGWHELHTTDAAAALDFYLPLYGWTRGDAMDMGPAGTYQVVNADGVPLGGVMPKAPEEPPLPYWLYYFTSTDLDAAKGRVEAGGGTVLAGPAPVPGGGRFLVALDPQGAPFGLLEPGATA